LKTLEVVRHAISCLRPRRYPGHKVLLDALSAATVRADDGVGTACIQPASDGYVVYLSPTFCREELREPGDALVLIAHELLHALRGHFGLPTGHLLSETYLQNVVLDILVNAVVLRRVLFVPSSLLGRSYSHDRFPSVLLLPPKDLLRKLAAEDGGAKALCEHDHGGLIACWRERGSTHVRLERVVTRQLRSLDVHRPDAVARLYLDGWLGIQEPAGYWQRARALLLGDPRLMSMDLVFLGAHGQRDPRLSPLRGWDPFGGEKAVREVAPQASDHQIERFLREVRDAAVHSHQSRMTGVGIEPVRGIMPAAGRSEMLHLATGHAPVFYTRRCAVVGDQQRGVHIYIDASGSTQVYQSLYLGLARALGRALIEPTWAFSTEVFAVNGLQLERVSLTTTGGTTAKCLLRHALDNHFRRIVVMTDGDFDGEGPEWNEAKKRGLGVVWVVAGALQDGRGATQMRRLGTVLEVPTAMMPDDDIPF
jgi:hypothetical protein